MIRASCFSFEAAHNYYKVLARKQNFKNITMSLAKRIQMLDACQLGDAANNPSSHPLFNTEKQFGVLKKLNLQEVNVLRKAFDIYGLLPDLPISNVCRVSWVVIYGTRYRKGDMIIIDVDRNLLPIFSKIDVIWYVQQYVYFKVLLLETIDFDDKKQSYRVNLELQTTSIVTSENLVDYNTYHEKCLNNELFLPSKYSLKYILSEHVKGKNHLNLLT